MGTEDPEALTVSAALINHAMQGVRRSSHDLDELLAESGISPSSLCDSEDRVPVDRAIKLIRLCWRKLNDEAYGLMACPLPPGYTKICGLLALQAGTLGRALSNIVDQYNLFQCGMRIAMNTIGSKVEIAISRDPGNELADNYAIEATLITFHRFGGWLCNERIVLDQVTLDFPPPEYRNEYENMYFGAPILFEQTTNTIRFDTGYLSHKIIQNEHSLDMYARRIPLDIFLPLDAGGELGQTVRKFIQDAFAEQKKIPTMDELADSLKIPSHTLRRRLKDDGTSFHTIKSQVRRDIAIHHLGNPNTSVESIAEHTGYAEAGAFIRAFKSWTGFTPTQFRKGLKLP